MLLDEKKYLFRKKLWHVKRRQTCCSLTAFCVRKLFEETSILFRFLSRFLPEQFFSTADDNDDTKNHQQNGDDELQSLNEEDSGSCSIRFYKCDDTLNRFTVLWMIRLLHCSALKDDSITSSS